MPTDKPTELSRIKLKTWTRQPVPMISEHSAHLTPQPFCIRTWLWRYTCLLLLISMLWHRQAIFESKGDKLSSSAESRIRTHQGLRHQIASRLLWTTEESFTISASVVKELKNKKRRAPNLAQLHMLALKKCTWHFQRYYFSFKATAYNLWVKYTLEMITKTHTDTHDDVIKWKHFPRYWPLVRGIHRSPELRYKEQYCGTNTCLKFENMNWKDLFGKTLLKSPMPGTVEIFVNIVWVVHSNSTEIMKRDTRD